MIAGRRGACPGLAGPLPTGDGLLARLAVTRALSLECFADLCTAARTHGNGIIEITSRGSIQVRGLTAESAPTFAAAVEGLDIADAAAGRVLSNPLAGLDPQEIFDVTDVACELREALVATGIAAKLTPKVSVVIDGGGALSLDRIPCDIRLRVEAASEGVRFQITVAAHAAGEASLGTVAPEAATDAVLALLDRIAAHGSTSRARDLGHLPAHGNAARVPAHAIGTHRLRDGNVAVGIGVAFGHSDAETLNDLLEEARRAHAASVRPTPGRVLLIIGLPPKRAAALRAAADRLGFITMPDDPRRRVVACAGAPACAAAQIPTRALAPAVAATAALNLQTIHLSGCAKGCAHPGAATLTIVGREGNCGIVRNGCAQDVPTEFVAPDDLPRYLAQRAAMREADDG
jgi:precorrin-3B synthase